MKYAVIQHGYGILGIGETPLDAEQDAVEFGADIRGLLDYDESVQDGDACLIRITDELYTEVQEWGGDLAYDIHGDHPNSYYADLPPLEDRQQWAWEAQEERKFQS